MVSGAATASFVYDGDGRQVKAVVGSTTTYYVGAHYQVDNGVVTKYYFAGAQRVAMRKGSTLSYLLGDHLGSTSITTNTSGTLVSELRYKPWGETRYASGTTPTNYQFTGQRNEVFIGLYFYNARWYDSLTGRFAQADTDVPASQGVQGLDRYAYVSNNPLRYTDPTGHMAESEDEAGCSGQGPACIINMYSSYGDYEGMDRSLESFIRYHPDYDPNLDPELPYEQWSTVGMAQMRVGCDNGNGWACAGMVIIAGFSSPVPVIIQPAGSAPQNYGNDPADPDCPGCGYQINVQFPSNEGQLQHIFRNDTGHFAEDTAANRALMVDTVQSNYFVETDIHGNQIYAQQLSDGTEVWVEVRNGEIRNGGLNQTPRYTP